jgi:transposase
VTRDYKRGLNKEQRKQFRARMWEFRRRPQDLMAEPANTLEALFQEVPGLRVIYQLRWKLTGIFDEAADRGTAAAGIAAWCAEAEASGQDWGAFVGLYERHRDGILAYFEGRQTSGPVEGLNNKARVIIKRSYGLKSCDTLWTRLILDVNWVRERIGRTVEVTHALANRIWSAFCACYT